MTVFEPAQLAEADRIIKNALKEDIRSGDITTRAAIPPGSKAHAVIKAKSSGILAGIAVCSRAFTAINDNCAMFFPVEDGSKIRKNQVVFEIRGSTYAILKGERTALNILCRMSGIATLTRKFVDKVAGTGVKILDTRKTMPGLRLFDKYAVRAAGGENHRYALDDMFLIKENHIAVSGGIKNAIEKCIIFRDKRRLKTHITAETYTIDGACIAAEAGADRVLLDNMLPDEVKTVVKRLGKKIELEVSGGITLTNIRSYAESGVDYISIGSLTHSAPAVDFSLLII